jgi:hypothetical protein
MDSNASYAGEVERNVSRDNDFSLRGKVLQTASSFSAGLPTSGSPYGFLKPLS